VRSTQTVEQNASDANGSAQSGAASIANQLPNGQNASAPAPGATDNNKSTSDRTEETTNYEISKTVKTSSEDGGTLKKVSVAVVVDGQTTTDAISGKANYRPRTPAEMKQIESLVSSTVGLDKSRGDQLQVTNMQFAQIDSGQGVAAPTPFLGLDGAYWFKIIEAAILSITALLIGFFVARPLIARMFAPIAANGQPLFAAASAAAGHLPAPGASATGEIAHDGPAPLVIPARKGASIDLSQIEGQVKESAVRKVGEVVQAHPEEALAILRTWLHQQA
jgi:flagellar M-ring protein FliF